MAENFEDLKKKLEKLKDKELWYYYSNGNYELLDVNIPEIEQPKELNALAVSIDRAAEKNDDDYLHYSILRYMRKTTGEVFTKLDDLLPKQIITSYKNIFTAGLMGDYNVLSKDVNVHKLVPKYNVEFLENNFFSIGRLSKTFEHSDIDSMISFLDTHNNISRHLNSKPERTIHMYRFLYMVAFSNNVKNFETLSLAYDSIFKPKSLKEHLFEYAKSADYGIYVALIDTRNVLPDGMTTRFVKKAIDRLNV